VNSGFADRGLTTWLPRRTRPSDLIGFRSIPSLVANFRDETQMSGRQLRIIPCNGNRAYNYYPEGDKVNGKRKRLCSRDEAAANGRGTVRRTGEANRSSGNIQTPMTGRGQRVGRTLSPFADAITRWQYRFGSGLGIGCCSVHGVVWRYLLKKSRVRCQASLAAPSS
jgi:hypothetical protein